MGKLTATAIHRTSAMAILVVAAILAVTAVVGCGGSESPTPAPTVAAPVSAATAEVAPTAMATEAPAEPTPTATAPPPTNTAAPTNKSQQLEAEQAMLQADIAEKILPNLSPEDQACVKEQAANTAELTMLGKAGLMELQACLSSEGAKMLRPAIASETGKVPESKAGELECIRESIEAGTSYQPQNPESKERWSTGILELGAAIATIYCTEPDSQHRQQLGIEISPEAEAQLRGMLDQAGSQEDFLRMLDENPSMLDQLEMLLKGPGAGGG